MFSISSRARDRIVSERNQTNIKQPVATLQYELGSLDPSGATAQALRRGDDLNIVKEAYRHESGATKQARHLAIAFHARDDMPADDLLVASDIEFCIPRQLASFLTPYELDVDETGRLGFFDSHGNKFEY